MAYIAPLGSEPISNSSRNYSHITDDRNTAQTKTLVNRREDVVDLSDNARLMSKLRGNSGMRHELIQQIRDEIAAGNYDTEEKLNIAIDNMINDFIS